MPHASKHSFLQTTSITEYMENLVRDLPSFGMFSKEEVKSMPLTKKGAKIKRSMQKTYGKKKGAKVFYASQNKGTIKGTHTLRGKR